VTIEALAALALIGGMGLCGVACVRGRSPVDRLIALELASVLAPLAFILIAVFFHRPGFVDLGLALGILSLPSALVFIRFLERWI
jgi:multisubunit Na+/H+ antiporter MnhF subunit